jgi:hypothetical protein
MKKVAVIFVILAAGIMLSTSLPLISATPSTPVSGTWVGVSGSHGYSNIHSVGGNVFVDSHNDGIYTQGSILGTFSQTFSVVIHYGSPEIVQNLNPANPASHPEAPFNWRNMQRTFTGTVLGVEGGFTMKLEAKGYGNSIAGISSWELTGTWVILEGTGGLEGLHGQGTWRHTREVPGLQYEGQVHFEP